MSLVLRSTKGSKLTISEMDGNLLYLESLALSGNTSGGTTNPAGNNQEIQYNDNGTFGASSGFTYDQNNNQVNLSGILNVSNLINGYIFSNPKTITGTIDIPDNTNAVIIGPDITIDPNADINIGLNSELSIFNPNLPFTGNTSANCISDIWVENLNGCTGVINVNNNLNVSGSISAVTFYGDGSNLTGINGGAGSSGTSGTSGTDGSSGTSGTSGTSSNPAGNNTEIQYNDNGVFGASSGLTYNNSTNTTSIENIRVTQSIVLSGAASVGEPLIKLSQPDDTPWLFGLYNESFSANTFVFGGWVSNDGDTFIGTEINKALNIYTNAQYFDPTVSISSAGVNIDNSLTAVTYYGDGSNLTGIISAGSVISVTYDELFSNYVGNTLSAGTYYLISDYQTCYDQPDFDNMGNAITSGNYKTGNTEPLIVLAISGNAISSNVYSPTFPNHTIKYDIDFTTTEVTNNLAKGRITERIDEYGNRADYDFVAVQFKRYSTYFCERFYQGTVSIDSGNGLVTGIGTTFTSDFIEGDVLAVYTPYNSPIGCFMYYEIITVNDNTSMQVTGTTILSMNNVGYSRGEYMGQLNPFQCNLFTSSGYSEYYTFNNNQNYNTYLGNYASLINTDGNTFLLSNNVFLNGNYDNNVFGDGVFSNTFDDDMDSNTTGTYFQYNIINDDFDRNNVGVRFRNNIIICDMADNRIGNYFEYNMLGDDDGQDFDNNFIGDGFARNFLTFSNGDFYNNNIGDDFYENLIDRSFQNNSMVGTVYQNSFIGDFNENKVGYSFYQNSIYNNFWKNNIGDSFNTNTIGTINNIGGYLFENNEIMNNFKGNLIAQDFWSNRIKTDFKGNQTWQEFGYNNIGFGCALNTFNGITNQNTIGDYFAINTLLGSFSHNTIGVNFGANAIGDGFGFGGGQYKGNIIGNNFYSNTIGEYFYDNFIRDNFTNNTVVDYFQQNTVTNDVTYINFTTATTVYGYYNCQIFRRSDEALRLSYYDENDVLVITDITN